MTVLDAIRDSLPPGYVATGVPEQWKVGSRTTTLRVYIRNVETGRTVAVADEKARSWSLLHPDGTSRRWEGPECGVWGGPHVDGRWRLRLAEFLKAALEREKP